jgi:hypothetical protein
MLRKRYIAIDVVSGVPSILALMYAFRNPLWHTFIDAPPPVIVGMHDSDWEDDRTFTAAVFREFPDTATEAGLRRELLREHFAIDRKKHYASYYWTEPASENWLLIEWQTSRDGRVARMTHNWQCGC